MGFAIAVVVLINAAAWGGLWLGLRLIRRAQDRRLMRYLHEEFPRQMEHELKFQKFGDE